MMKASERWRSKEEEEEEKEEEKEGEERGVEEDRRESDSPKGGGRRASVSGAWRKVGCALLLVLLLHPMLSGEDEVWQEEFHLQLQLQLQLQFLPQEERLLEQVGGA